jgi:putative FmdB family regulatory protein
VPTYQYACTACDERLEAVQSFTDAPLTACPACGGALRKVFSAVGVVFKGSGFYKTDSRASGKAATADSASSSTSSETTSTPAPAKESKPAVASPTPAASKTA